MTEPHQLPRRKRIPYGMMIFVNFQFSGNSHTTSSADGKYC